MVTWNCTSCLSAAVVVLLSDYLKWDFLVQMCILDTVTSNPGVLLSPYASRPPQLFKFQDTWLKRTHAWSLQKWLGWQEKSDHTMRVQNAATNWYNRSLQLPYARYCLGTTSSNACFSHPPLKNGNAIETSRRRNVPTSRCAAGLSALLPAVPPSAAGIGVEKGLHTLLCLLAYAGESPAYPASAVTACGGGGEVVLQPLRKLVVSILSFAAAALFFCSLLITPPAPPCEWYVWTISFKTSFLSRLDG